MSPVIVPASSSPSSSKSPTKPVRRAESAHAQSRRTRVVRRRGRGRLSGVESDDEIERDVLSDASDSEEPSLVDSATDSEAESDAEPGLLRNGRHRPDTPSTTQSPPPGEVEAAAALNGFAVAKPDSESGALEPPRSAPAFLSAGVNWSDMVADEGINGDASLPVIDFADLHEHAGGGSPPTITKHLARSVSVASGNEREDDVSNQRTTDRPRRGDSAGSRAVPHSAGQSVRQAYQQRLQTDPSFVPTVGEFWGHDDRLIQKDLRSLSGWWRGRWQGRGRGRGGFSGRGMRGRGRGGYFGGPRLAPQDGEDAAQPEPSQPSDNDPAPEPDLQPIEMAWTHDGFEEMKANDERRRAAEQQRVVKPYNRPAPPGAPNASFRGGFTPRGRGTFAQQRGGFSPTRGRAGAPFVSYHSRSQADRTWYAMKPERVWTKQFEGFLYIDPSLKPKPGRAAGYRVSLPGKGLEVIRAELPTSLPEEAPPSLHSQPPSEVALAAGKKIIVKVPKRTGKEKAKEDTSKVLVMQPESFTTVEELPVDFSTSPPAPSSPNILPPTSDGPALSEPEPLTAQISQPSTAQPSASSADAGPSAPTMVAPQPLYYPIAQHDVMATPSLTRDSSSSEKSVADVPAVTAQTAAFSPESVTGAAEIVPAGPVPPMQTVFPPSAQPSPTYSSPYGFAPAPPFPPGIVLNQQGFAYEVASGRPVYLHATPPPPIPLYNPRPLPFVPGHMHHHSLSADFMQPSPSTPPLNGFVDPATGQPLFSLPRQNSRIEIRAPTDATEGKNRSERRPSSLRSTTFGEPSRPTPPPPPAAPAGLTRYVLAPEFFPEASGGAPPRVYQPQEGGMSLSPGIEERPLVAQPAIDPGMMGYGGYQQYYYPEQYYPAYVEMPQQPGQYDPYTADPHHQPPVYY